MRTVLGAPGTFLRGALFLLFLICLLAPLAHALSEDFTALQREVDQEYFRPRGLTLLAAQEREPLLLSGAMGHALRHQYLLAQGNPARLDYLKRTVEPETAGYMEWLATRFGTLPAYRASDGHLLGAQELLDNFGGALGGKDDDYFARQFGIVHASPATPAPSMRAAPAVPPVPSSPGLFFPRTQNAPAQGNAIDLLGQVAPRMNQPPPLVQGSPPGMPRPAATPRPAKEAGTAWECRSPGTYERKTVWWKVTRPDVTRPAICHRPGAFAPYAGGCTAKGQYLCCDAWPGGVYFAEGAGRHCTCVSEGQFTKAGCTG